MKKVLIALLSIGLISCSMPILNNTSKYSDLDREYSQFKTEALTQSYLKKKMDKWLSDNKYSKNLVREIEYAKFKHPDTLKDIVALQPTMFNDIIGDTSVNQKRNESSFENYIEYIDPFPSSGTATSATNVTTTGFTANWSAVTGATGYKLYVDGTPITLGNVTTHDVTGLTNGSLHTYYVKSTNSAGESQSSNTVSVTLPLTTPVATDATNITATGFTANWNFVTGATNYKLYIDSNSPIDVGNVKTYVVSGLSIASSHTYKVKAFNDNVISSDSNVINVLTALPAPVALDGSSFTTTGFTANWNTVTGATGYKLYVDDMTTGEAVNKYIITVSGQASTNYAVTGLTSTSNYIYYVKAIGASGDGLSSNTIPISDLRFGLVAYYPFSGNANDTSGFSHNGTCYNVSLASDRKGNTNKAYYFNGNGTAITVGAIPEVTSGMDWTVSYWMNPDVIQNYLNTMDFNYVPTSNNAGPRFELSNGNGFSFITGWNQNQFTGVNASNRFTAGQWSHVVGIRNGNTKILYIDNVNVGSQTTDLLPGGFGNLIIGIGYKNLPERVFIGSMDDIRVYKRALTSQEIDTLYHE